MKRLFVIFFLLIVLGLGGARWAHLRTTGEKAAVREMLDLRNARIEELRASPAYRRLIERGTEVCPGQPHQTVWACGATIRMPENSFPSSASHRKCSSQLEPKYVGSFSLPEVISAEPETKGLRVQVSIPSTSSRHKGYIEGGLWLLDAEELPAFVSCDVRKRRECSL